MPHYNGLTKLNILVCVLCAARHWQTFQVMLDNFVVVLIMCCPWLVRVVAKCAHYCHLNKVYCLPSLTYGCGTWTLNDQSIILCSSYCCLLGVLNLMMMMMMMISPAVAASVVPSQRASNSTSLCLWICDMHAPSFRADCIRLGTEHCIVWVKVVTFKTVAIVTWSSVVRGGGLITGFRWFLAASSTDWWTVQSLKW